MRKELSVINDLKMGATTKPLNYAGFGPWKINMLFIHEAIQNT